LRRSQEFAVNFAFNRKW